MKVKGKDSVPPPVLPVTGTTTLTLVCDHDPDDPTFTYKWFKSTYPSRAHRTGRTFTIESYDNTDDADYQCEVESDGFSKTSQPLRLQLQITKPRITGAPERVNNGTLLKISCFSPSPKYKKFVWLKDGERIPGTNTSSRALKFLPFKYGDDGEYKCRASDVNGEEWEESEPVSMTTVSRYELCKCRCPPGIANMSMTEEELEVKVKEIEEKLIMDVSSLSAYRYTKQAREDQRKAAVRIGKSITVLFFCLVFGTIVVLDGFVMVTYLYEKYAQMRREREEREEEEREERGKPTVQQREWKMADRVRYLEKHKTEGYTRLVGSEQ